MEVNDEYEISPEWRKYVDSFVGEAALRELQRRFEKHEHEQ